MARIEDDMNTSFTDDKQRAVVNVIFTANWIQAMFNDFIQPFKLSHQQFNILRILRGAKDWLSMQEVRKRMIEKSPNATRLCDKLLDKGLIERSRCDNDRRVVFIKISSDGLDLLQEIDELGIPNDFLDNITDEEAQVLSKVLDKLRG